MSLLTYVTGVWLKITTTTGTFRIFPHAPRRKIQNDILSSSAHNFINTKKLHIPRSQYLTIMKFSLAVLSVAATASAFTAFNAPSRSIGASRVATSSVFAPVAVRNVET